MIRGGRGRLLPEDAWNKPASRDCCASMAACLYSTVQWAEGIRSRAPSCHCSAAAQRYRKSWQKGHRHCWQACSRRDAAGPKARWVDRRQGQPLCRLDDLFRSDGPAPRVCGRTLETNGTASSQRWRCEVVEGTHAPALDPDALPRHGVHTVSTWSDSAGSDGSDGMCRCSSPPWSWLLPRLRSLSACPGGMLLHSWSQVVVHGAVFQGCWIR